MAKIYMVRHGKATASWGEHPDPGLDEAGQEQARALAARFAKELALPILTSPKARAQETAAPLCRQWQTTAIIEPRVTEIPSPDQNLGVRSDWLRQVMAGTWSAATPAVQQWRENVIRCILEQTGDAIFFSHYIAINVVAGAALGLGECTVFRPDYCSVTCFSVTEGVLELIEQGSQASTKVN